MLEQDNNIRRNSACALSNRLHEAHIEQIQLDTQIVWDMYGPSVAMKYAIRKHAELLEHERQQKISSE